ncbi:hypothetical protein Sinac_5844 [Singulisphaera acidiphila DSM 18658]|uniref:Uncharacterized protein n=1 Tax=Singulisphaera acidiphila (strain ATCC BAA-1392 / DSM 18658 / VKM B-2454 / MOB10) TaxID=886293 RepID=L0DMC4_SINAD|nr:hypothetical protein Sinac_5844 [Singulisphaera acidiphila DSM 18658]
MNETRVKAHWSGVSFMGSFHGKKGRFPHLLIAILAVLGLEFDVLCNPFAPTLILHRILRPFDSQESVTADGEDQDPVDSTATVFTPVPKARLSGEKSNRSDGPSQLDETPDMDDTVTVRAPTSASSLTLADPFLWGPLPWSGLVSHFQEFHFPIISRLSSQSQLCRFLC